MTTVRNLEETEVKLNARQMAIYIGGIIMGTCTVVAAYMGISGQLKQLADDNAALRQEIKNITIRMDSHQSQAEVRYLEIKLELEKKQDKKS